MEYPILAQVPVEVAIVCRIPWAAAEDTIMAITHNIIVAMEKFCLEAIFAIQWVPFLGQTALKLI